MFDYIIYKQLNWYGQVRRMNKARLPQRILEWCPLAKRRKERSGNSGMQEVKTGMREKGNNSAELINREERRRKLKLQINHVSYSFFP